MQYCRMSRQRRSRTSRRLKERRAQRKQYLLLRKEGSRTRLYRANFVGSSPPKPLLRGPVMSFLHNVTPEWLEKIYLVWQEDPDRLSADWRAFFEGFEAGRRTSCPPEPENNVRQSAVESLINRYRDSGHLLACTDPLSPCKIDHPLLSLSAFGLEDADLNTIFKIPSFYQENAPLVEILAVMRETYCRSIGIEFMYIQEPAERQWLIDRMEPVRNRPVLTRTEKLGILGKLMEGTLFEEF